MAFYHQTVSGANTTQRPRHARESHVYFQIHCQNSELRSADALDSGLIKLCAATEPKPTHAAN